MVTPGPYQRLWHIYLACALSARLSSSRHRHFIFALNGLNRSRLKEAYLLTVLSGVALLLHFFENQRKSCLEQQQNLVQRLIRAGRFCAWLGAVEFLEILMLSRVALWQPPAVAQHLVFEWFVCQDTTLWMLWL
jgi:hypothetical protein